MININSDIPLYLPAQARRSYYSIREWDLLKGRESRTRRLSKPSTLGTLSKATPLTMLYYSYEGIHRSCTLKMSHLHLFLSNVTIIAWVLGHLGIFLLEYYNRWVDLLIWVVFRIRRSARYSLWPTLLHTFLRERITSQERTGPVDNGKPRICVD